jgi:phage host-nuclease inhibitor protein Gam
MKKEHFEILLEEMRSKFDLVFEGHDMLNRKIDRVAADLNQRIMDVDRKIDRVAISLTERIEKVNADLTARIEKVNADLTARIDKVAADLTAHRADTESHRGYRVAER